MTRPPDFIEPPAALAIMIEMLGCCPSCAAPLRLAPLGFYVLDHCGDCKLAAEIEASI